MTYSIMMRTIQIRMEQPTNVNYNISSKGAEIGDNESDDKSNGLASFQGSDSNDVGNKNKLYKQFNEKHDLNTTMVLVVGEQFTDIYSFKRALKIYVVQNGFNYFYKHNDKGRVSAICKDSNDDMLPIAFAVAKAEIGESWEWFINILGLGTAVEVVLSHVEHCFYVRHLHANFKTKGYTGKAFKGELWGAARAFNIYAFEHHMQKIMLMDVGAHTYLSGVPSASWSRHAFSYHSKNDMLLNNLAESFNALIKDAKSKHILTMVEDIRRQIMIRFQQKKDGIRSTQYSICPKIQKKLERSKSDAINCISRWQNKLEFEVNHVYDTRCIVRLDNHTCMAFAK
ncbi:uncharacterized protein LOC132178221 [Corylus avellana]|uniref:uncharacterized protein LOC132178221 n=1 Tax=Corylus avellana TaxID=13451 RepID=UPI00286BD3C3|nr:uncharacterized protein LOC132178221 [Corylus avellana]